MIQIWIVGGLINVLVSHLFVFLYIQLLRLHRFNFRDFNVACVEDDL